MGVVFGRMQIEEPAFEVLLQRTGSQGFSYEVRKYGTRFAAETANSGDKGFMTLARYIGVVGSPENEPHESISMTAPVVKKADDDESTKSTVIAMTAPVVKAENEQGQQVMQFMLPSKYNTLDKIPKPTNMAVHIREIPPATGAVHRYSGSYSEEVARQKVMQLAQQLQQDGLTGRNLSSQEWVWQNHMWFGYNPPFTLPPFRRVEVFLPLTPEQVEQLTKGFATSEAN